MTVAKPDPVSLGESQLRRDRARPVPIADLVDRKIAKMALSPLAFLRGSAPLFHEMLAEHPELWEGPDGEGNLCGDAHVENFGVFRTARPKAKGAAPDDAAFVFDVNDFDETVVGPFRLDVLRLLASLILAGRQFVVDGKRTIALCRALMTSYAGAAFLGSGLPAVPGPVAELLAKVERRSARDMLDRRTVLVGKERRFTLGDRYLALPRALEQPAREAFAQYVRALGDEKLTADHCRVVDLAFRVAGTGSLGSTRVAVLAEGKGGDQGWLFDMKEEGTPAASVLVGAGSQPGAERVVAGMRASLESPPRMMGTTRLGELSMIVRRLAPQEDKLDLTRAAKTDLEGLAGYLGGLLGRAHRRGATKLPPAPWNPAEREALVDRAITIAGIHEAAYLAFCKA
jgi:uncharacterized protein (DUF2252 family)